MIRDGSLIASGSYDELSHTLQPMISLSENIATGVCQREEHVSSLKEQQSHQTVPAKIKDVISSDGKLMSDETLSRGTVRKEVYLRYFRLVPCISIIPIAFLMSQGLDVASSYWITLWSQQPVSVNGHKNQKVVTGILILAVMTLLSGAFHSLASFAIARGTVRAAVALHDQLLASVLHSSMAFFETTPAGRILNRFLSDMDSMDSGMCQGLVNFFSFSSQAVSILIIVMIAVPYYAPVVLVLVILFYIVYFYGMAGERQVKRMDATTRSFVYSAFAESLSGKSTIRAFAASDWFRTHFEEAVDSNLRCVNSHNELLRWRAMRLDLLGNVTVIASAGAALLMKTMSNDDVTDREIFLIGLAAVYAMKLPITLNLIVRGLTEVDSNAVAVERVLSYIDNEREDESGDQEADPAPSDWPSSQPAIEIQNFSTRFREGCEIVLHDLNVEIRRGETMAIVGRTGAGKSTIAASLFRLMEAASGQIIVDGVDIKRLRLKDLRSRLSIIPQDAVIFSGTIRFNVDPWEQESDEEVWRVLGLAHLSDCVRRLDGQLYHRLSPGGEQDLSSGQRQLLCLARALIRKSSILVLDEATASLDQETESKIMTAIRKHLTDGTIIVIAHNIHSVLNHADRVMVMRSGRVVELNEPNILLADPSSAFHALFKQLASYRG